MPVGTRTVKLGRLRAPLLLTSLQETVGDLLETVGGGVVAGDRRPRPFQLELPIRGYGDDGNAAAHRLAGERARRQARSLMDNTRVKLDGLYFHAIGDHELSAFLVIGGGHIEMVGQAALARGEWKLVLQDCFRVGTHHTHYDARRVELLDRRLATSPRDYRGQLYSTAFANQQPLAITFLPPGFRAAMGRMHVLNPANLRTLEGHIGVVPDLMDGEVVTYEQREGLRHHADVVAYDRRGVTTYAATNRSNLIANPSFEENTTGWTTGGTNTMQRVYGPGRDARSGHYGLKVTYSNNLLLASALVTISAAQHTFSIFVKIPREWTGGQIIVDAVNFTGSTGETSVNADMSIRDTWQRISVTLTVAGGDLSGAFEVRADSPPAVGQFVYLDDALLQTGATATAYFDGDSRASRWASTPHASLSTSFGDPEDFGWEEIFGENWPLWDYTDPPVLQNGLCRVRLEPSITTAVTFAIDVENSAAQGGWQEEGRFYCYIVTGPTYFNTILASHLIEWTPERAVVAVHLTTGAGANATLYITLQRGWTAPRLEVYAHLPEGGALGGDLAFVYAPFNNGAYGYFSGDTSANPVDATISDQPSPPAGGVHTFGVNDEPWFLHNDATLAGVRHSTVVSVPDTTHTVGRIADTVGYGATRQALLIGATATLYVSALLAFMWPQPMLEAEAGTNGGGSTDVADANARGGNAVESTNTAEPGDASVSFTEAQLDANFNESAEGSLVGVWARVRAVNADGVVSLKFRFGSAAYSSVVTYDVETYAYVKLGEAPRDHGESLDIRLWRSAGTGNVRIDVVIAIPLERRDATYSTLDYGGVRDYADRSLYDSRQIPDLVAR